MNKIFSLKIFSILIFALIFNCNNENKKNDNFNQTVLLSLSLNKENEDNQKDKDSVDQKTLRIFTKGRSSFILTPEHKLFAFGNNQFGQLGLGDSAASSIKTPTEVIEPTIKGKVKHIFNGLNSTFVLTNEGKLFAFGDNASGQLGLGDSAARSIKTPTEVTETKIKDKVKQVSGGRYHTLLSTTDGKLFAFGLYNDGRLGLANSPTPKTNSPSQKVKVPTEVDDANIKGKVDKIFVGDSSNFVLTNEGKLFAFGSNTTGQLG